MKLSCEMIKDCPETVTHIDEKGFVYCCDHGKSRKYSMRCRKLKSTELKILKSGKPITKYN